MNKKAKSSGRQKFISIQALKYLGYTVDGGDWVQYGPFEGNLMYLEDEDSGEEMDFCFLQTDKAGTGIIIPYSFEDTLFYKVNKWR